MIVTLELPESQKAFVLARIAMGEYKDASAYILALIEREHEAKLQLEANLRAAMSEEDEELTREDWDEIEREADQQLALNQAQSSENLSSNPSHSSSSGLRQEPSDEELVGQLIMIMTAAFNRSLSVLEDVKAIDTRKMRSKYTGVGSLYYDLVTDQMFLTATFAIPGIRQLFSRVVASNEREV